MAGSKNQLSQLILLLILSISNIFAAGYGLQFSTSIYNHYSIGLGLITYGDVKYWGFEATYHYAWNHHYKAINIALASTYRLDFFDNIGISIGSITGVGYLFTDRTFSEHIESFLGVFYQYKHGIIEMALHTMVDPYHKKSAFNNSYCLEIKYLLFF